jgi:hypothetical protein
VDEPMIEENDADLGDEASLDDEQEDNQVEEA